MAQANNMSNMAGNLGGIAYHYFNQPDQQSNQGSINPTGGYWGGNQGGMFYD